MNIDDRTKNLNNQNDLEYIQIDHKNKIVELPSEMHITEASFFLNSLTPFEENIGREINNFFLNVLPENKEGEVLKVITVVANKAKIDKNILHKYLTNILNRQGDDIIILNRELSEEISLVLKEIFRKIKKKAKIKSYEDIKIKSQNYMDNLQKEKFLSNFKVKASSEILDKNNIFGINNNNLKNENNNDKDFVYEYKEIKLPDIPLPIEMIILLSKFSMTKTLRLTINSDYYSINNETSKSNEYLKNTKDNELENIILILLNLDWLFSGLVNLELDLSNLNLIESQINLHKYSLDAFSKFINKEIKITAYQVFNDKNKSKEPLYKSIIPQFSFIEEDEFLCNKTSTSNISADIMSLKQDFDFNEVNYSDEKYNKEMKKFIKKYISLIEMIIIYGYFIGKMETIINAKLIMPINIGDEILQYLKNKNIFIDEFHILSFITKKNLINISLDFNSLDGQTFEKVLNFLNQNNSLGKCHINFFPEEEFYKSELLFKLLQSCDDNFKLKRHKNNTLGFNPNIIFSTKTNESLDEFVLRQLAEYFEKNMQNFFYLLTMKTNIVELGLCFNIPTIIKKSGYYNNVLMKFFLNLFILIDSPFNNNIKKLSLLAENFIFDSRKYPILNDFCDKLNCYTNKSHKMQSLTFHVKFYHIPQIYRFIPYNLIHLSIGSLDYETFEGLVNYLTSADFGIRTELSQLKISLNNSLIDINQGKIYNILSRLFTEYPKGLKEITLITYLIMSYEKINNLLLKTNYNTLPNIYLQFSVKSIISRKRLEEILEYDLSNDTKNLCLKTDSFVDLYTVKRNNDLTNKIINLMTNLVKINKDILQYEIFLNIEKFLCPNEKKNVVIQFR